MGGKHPTPLRNSFMTPEPLKLLKKHWLSTQNFLGSIFGSKSHPYVVSTHVKVTHFELQSDFTEKIVNIDLTKFSLTKERDVFLFKKTSVSKMWFQTVESLKSW